MNTVKMRIRLQLSSLSESPGKNGTKNYSFYMLPQYYK
jgi:hypothetical protein